MPLQQRARSARGDGTRRDGGGARRRRSSRAGWGTALAGLLFLLAAGLVAGTLPGYVTALNRSPPERVRRLPALPAPRDPGPARSLLWILVDGLRDDALGRMPHVMALARQGVRLRLDVGQPSFSRPVYASLGTGAEQRHTGIRTNRTGGPVLLDSLFARLAAGGRRAVAVMERIGWWAELFGPALEHGGVTVGVEPLLARALELRGRSELLLVHFTGVDHFSHLHGPGSPEVAAEIERADRAIGRLLAGLDLQRWTVLVHSDHGHVPAGGHGGDSPDVVLAPAVLAGAGIRPQPETLLRPLPALAIDLAPTLAVLLGCAMPAHAEGRILGEAMAIPPARLDELEQRLAAGQERLWRSWLVGLGEAESRPGCGTTGAASAGAAQLRSYPKLALREGEAGLLRKARLQGGLAAALLVSLLLLLGLRIGRGSLPPRSRRWWLLASLSYPALAAVAYTLAGGEWSFSDVPLRAVFARRLALLLALAGAPLAAAVLWHLRRAPRARRTQTARALVWVLLPGVALGHAAALAGSAALVPGVQLAGPTALFLPLVTGPMLAAFLVAAGVLLLSCGLGSAACPRRKTDAGSKRGRGRGRARA